MLSDRRLVVLAGIRDLDLAVQVAFAEGPSAVVRVRGRDVLCPVEGRLVVRVGVVVVARFEVFQPVDGVELFVGLEADDLDRAVAEVGQPATGSGDRSPVPTPATKWVTSPSVAP